MTHFLKLAVAVFALAQQCCFSVSYISTCRRPLIRQRTMLVYPSGSPLCLTVIKDDSNIVILSIIHCVPFCERYTLKQFCYNAGPASATPAQRYNNIVSALRVDRPPSLCVVNDICDIYLANKWPSGSAAFPLCLFSRHKTLLHLNA